MRGMKLFFPKSLVHLCPAIVCALLLGSASFVSAVESTKLVPTSKEVSQWIRQLGSANFIVRENAAQRLLAGGDFAEEAIAKSTLSTDREVRDRSLQILALVHKRRRVATLTAFRTGQVSESSIPKIPGWSEFSKRYGVGPKVRAIYAEMLQAEWDLLANCFPADDSMSAIRRLISERHYQLERNGGSYRNYPRGTVLTFFMLAARYPDDFAIHIQLNSFASHPEIQRMLMATPDPTKLERTVVRKLIGDWILAASGKHLRHILSLQMTLYYRMREEGRIIAERVLTSRDAPPMSKSMAMQAIVLCNDTTQSHLIEPLLNDTTVLGPTGRDRRERQLRDIALACLMKLHGHDVGKIGVTAVTNSTHNAFDYGSLGYTSETQRQNAFETFRKLQAEKKSTEKSSGS